MASWRVAKSLLELRSQVDARWPNRNKENDGTIGDTRHAATKSEHNPDANGVVRAMDITNDPAHGPVARSIAESLIASRDPRVLYVISNAQICSSQVAPWTWRPYKGINDHRHHVHVSVVEDPKLYDDVRPWAFEAVAPKPVIAKTPAAPTTPAETPLPASPPTKPPVDVVARAVEIAAASDVARHDWPGRGRAPIGYVKGMAAVFALAYSGLKAGDAAPVAMARQNSNDDEHDAISWYNSNFRALGMTNDVPGADVLRHVFVLLLGLGMSESSGQWCEGWDREEARDRLTADSAEAGLFQMSWNAHAASPLIGDLMTFYRNAPDSVGLRTIFQEGVPNKPVANFGTGPGRDFQVLCKSKPAFAVEAAAVGLRVIGGTRGQWGPVRRKEAELVPAADTMFKAVQAMVDAAST